MDPSAVPPLDWVDTLALAHLTRPYPPAPSHAGPLCLTARWTTRTASTACRWRSR